jgi:hypothetical protein
MISAFFYSYQTSSANLTANLVSYPYQGYSLALVAFGSLLTGLAFVSYSKRGSNIHVEAFSSEDKAN